MVKRLKNHTKDPIYFDFGGGRCLGRIVIKEKYVRSKNGKQVLKRKYFIIPEYKSKKNNEIKIEIFSNGKKRVYFKDGVLKYKTKEMRNLEQKTRK